MDAFIGEIRMFGGNYAPQGWALCDGRLLSISENEVLFALIGTTYGGDGQTTFAVPDLRGRIPIHQGTNPSSGTSYSFAQAGGTESVTLTTNHLPSHVHPVLAQSEPGVQKGAAGGVWAKSGRNQYLAADANQAMNANAVQPAGGSQPHDNVMPFLVVNMIIAVQGIFPQQS